MSHNDKEPIAMTPRMQRACEGMEREGMDLLLLTPSSNLKYLLGSAPVLDERLFLLVLAPGREPFLLANALYALEVEQMPVPTAVFWQDGEDPYPLLQRELERRDIRAGTVGVDRSSQAMFLLPLMSALPAARFVPADPVLDALRVYKDEEERACLREACRRADTALRRTVAHGEYWIGKREGEFYAQLCFEMHAIGLERPDACICAGPNAADPHYTGGSGVIRAGSCLLVDFGGTYRNYYTDMTRTFHFGAPEEEFRRIHAITCRANEAGRAAARLGGRMEDVDAAARAVIEGEGYGPYFIHRTGHGIGIDVHESPNAAVGERAEIRPGMAFTVEPGIYLPGRFGVRIEDEILMTEAGAEVLHTYPRELIVL